MQIKEILKKILNIFKRIKASKQVIEESTYTIATLNSIVPMPIREDFLGDEARLELINQYKKEYLEALKQNHYISSLDLMPAELQNFKNIYLELLIKLYMKNNDDISFAKVNKPKRLECKNLNLSITYTKVKLYWEDIKNLELETRLRLVALNEILNDLVSGRRIILLRKSEWVSALTNEINNLHYALAQFLDQEVAMLKETSANLNEIDLIDNGDSPSKDEEETEIVNRLNDLKASMQLLIPEYLREIETLNLNSKLLIARLEQKLEIFVYTYEGMLAEIALRVDEIHKNINKSLTPKLRDEYLKEVKYLEFLYKIFYNYGRNLVSIIDVEKLYEVKFNLLTFDMYSVDTWDILNEVTVTELECYEKLVMAKIVEAVDGRSIEIRKILQENNFSFALNSYVISLIQKILKNNEKFDPKEILANKQLLTFLLALNKENGIEEFFKRFKVARANFPDLNFYERIFTWDDELPYETIFRIKGASKKNIKGTGWSLYELYNLTHYISASDTYKFPEGLQKIYLDPKMEFTVEENNILNEIRDKCQDKNIVFPLTLREMVGCIFQYVSVKDIKLNNGLEILGPYSLLNTAYKDLIIPPSVRYISPEAYGVLDSIEFTDYYNSYLLNNEEELKQFFRAYFLKNSYFDATRTYPVKEDAVTTLFVEIRGLSAYCHNHRFVIRLPESSVLDFLFLRKYKLNEDNINEIIKRLYRTIENEQSNFR